MNQMNMHGNVPVNPPVGAAPNVGMHIPSAGTVMQQPSPQQMQPGPGPGGPGPGPAMPQQPQQDKMDNISKVKTLMGSLREAIPTTLKSAAQILHQNHTTDSNSQKGVTDTPVLRFDKNLEELYSLCDQMELHLRTAVTCIQQAQSASHYLPLTVIPSRLDSGSTQETTLSYPAYLNTVRLQISYAKDIHDLLVAAAQNIAPTE
ncbi:mediator of RNA polymerase II transcription subunit 29-like [Pectinophora gossypiella]|nr:mediator of RNA polymerase II transcription subunit 29-like [Pectinophora gossypiella]